MTTQDFRNQFSASLPGMPSAPSSGNENRGAGIDTEVARNWQEEQAQRLREQDALRLAEQRAAADAAEAQKQTNALALEQARIETGKQAFDFNAQIANAKRDEEERRLLVKVETVEAATALHRQGYVTKQLLGAGGGAALGFVVGFIAYRTLFNDGESG